MKAKLALLMITKNSAALLEKSLQSVLGLVDEILLVDGNSTDNTIEIAKKYKAKIFTNDEEDLGKKRKFGLTQVESEWILILDDDEILSKKLKFEVKSLIANVSTSNILSRLNSHPAKQDQSFLTQPRNARNRLETPLLKQQVSKNFDSPTDSGFLIPFQNHFLGRPVNHGGENYRMLRLFKKNSVTIDPALVHEGFKLKKGKAGQLKNKIYHYSYRSISQMFSKFTDYALRDGRQKKERGEKTSIKKIILYPLHMFYARFIKDKGYKDGLFRIPLDIGFAYMEFLTYLSMLFFERSREE